MTRPSLTYPERAQLNELGFVRQSDGAERDAKLARVREALLAAQAVVLDVHRSVNLIDAVQGLETAIADVDFERERGEA